VSEPPIRYAALPSPVGPLYAAAGPHGLLRLHFGRGTRLSAFARSLPGPSTHVEPSDDPTLAPLAEELEHYFAGEPDPFTVHLDLRAGTPFRKRVWRALRRIPFGHTVAYGGLARRVGAPQGARAVGQAVGANPIAIVVPCHRVIRASGELGGFGGGLPIKRWLLSHEAALPTPC